MPLLPLHHLSVVAVTFIISLSTLVLYLNSCLSLLLGPNPPLPNNYNHVFTHPLCPCHHTYTIIYLLLSLSHHPLLTSSHTISLPLLLYIITLLPILLPFHISPSWLSHHGYLITVIPSSSSSSSSCHYNYTFIFTNFSLILLSLFHHHYIITLTSQWLSHHHFSIILISLHLIPPYLYHFPLILIPI